jgi:hypothetical protein
MESQSSDCIKFGAALSKQYPRGSHFPEEPMEMRGSHGVSDLGQTTENSLKDSGDLDHRIPRPSQYIANLPGDEDSSRLSAVY